MKSILFSTLKVKEEEQRDKSHQIGKAAPAPARLSSDEGGLKGSTSSSSRPRFVDVTNVVYRARPSTWALLNVVLNIVGNEG